MNDMNIASPAEHESAQLSDLVQFARANSPYYAKLYADIPSKGWQLADLPIIDGRSFWQGSNDLSTWEVLTGDGNDGLVFKTGGTTGTSKLSVFTRSEWKALTTSYARSIANHIKPEDKVANLFCCGDLYSSFLLIHGSMLNMEVPSFEYPFGGSVGSDKLIDQLIGLNINVLVAPPSMLLTHAVYLEKKNMQLPKIELILFGCESIFPSQMELIRKVMPNARVCSIGYACVDAGIVGSTDKNCKTGEHIVFKPETIVEIIDENSGMPITEPNKPGLLVVTDLRRRLMPIIRYPVGDRAAWCDEAEAACQKFVLKGRSSLGQRIRVGYASMYLDEFDRIITSIIEQHRWQLMLQNVDGCDEVVLRIARGGNSAEAKQIVDALFLKDGALCELRDRGLLHIKVEWASHAELETNPRTGKLLRVIDHRDYDISETSK